MKTTAEAAEALGVKPDKFRRILKDHPSVKPTTKFGGRWLSWTDADIEKAGKIVRYALHGVCPNCEWSPNDLPTDEPVPDAE